MKRIDMYIGKTVMLACLAVTFVVVGLDSVFGFLNEMDNLSDRYTLLKALEYAALTVPRRFYEFVGMATLVGCLVGLGALASSSELTVMRAAGISKLRILRAVMQPVLLLVLLGAGVGEFVAPRAEQSAEALRVEAIEGRSVGEVRYGVWHREGEWYMRFQAVRSDATLLGLTLYRFDAQRRLQLTRQVREARYENARWVLLDVLETRFLAAQAAAGSPAPLEQSQVNRYPRLEWEVELRPELLPMLAMEPEVLSLRDLAAYIGYLSDQGGETAAHKLAFWVKLLQPLAMLGLVLVGFTFIFGPLRSVTMGQRIMAGVLVGLVFKFSQDLLGPSSVVFGFSPLISALLPILICFAVGGWLLRRAG